MLGVTTYTDADLERMLEGPESDLVERKETFRGDAPDRVREAVCAFSNDLPDHRRGGVVFVGARNDGAPSGLEITDELLRALADIKTDGNILPPPSLTIGRRVLRGAAMAVIVVEPSDSPPVRYRGRIHVRVGPRRGLATAQDERTLNEKRRHRDRPFDLRPVDSATLADLDRRSFEDVYLPAAFAPEVVAANDRTYEQRLTATKMIHSPDEPIPTVLGVLVLATRTRDFLPGAYIQFLRIAGPTLADPIQDEQVIDGPIADVIRRADDKLAAHNFTAVDIAGGPVERRTHLYPMAALQQIVRNAVMHRTYENTNTPVHVYWFSDRLEVLSPGGPFGTVSPENFGAPGIVDYRNPNLAEALHVLGFVQRYGAGLPIARRELQRNGNPPPEFTVEQNHVACTMRVAP